MTAESFLIVKSTNPERRAVVVLAALVLAIEVWLVAEATVRALRTWIQEGAVGGRSRTRMVVPQMVRLQKCCSERHAAHVQAGKGQHTDEVG